MQSVCENVDVLYFARYISILINIIKVCVPITLILYVMFDFVKAISKNNDPSLKSTFQFSTRRVIAALAIFLVPTIITLVIKLSDPNNEKVGCLVNVSSEQIQKIVVSNSDKLVSQAEQTNDYNDYDKALSSINKIDDPELKKEYKERLAKVNEAIEKERKDAISCQISAQENENKISTEISSIESEDKVSTEVSETNNKEKSGIIFMGDSRTNGLKIYVSLPSTDKVYAKDGGTKKDFLNHSSQVKSLLNSNPDNSYNIVLNYGVNDLGSDYCTLYKNFSDSISSDNNIIIVSVNPVNDSKSRYVRNASIVNFNNKLKNCVSNMSNATYCDVYNKATINKWVESYVSSDGIHYTREGYKFIYSNIKSCIK